MKVKKFLKKAMTGLAVLSQVLFSSGVSVRAEEGPIKIGGNYELSGDNAAYGQPMSTGAELAIKLANENGGVLGRQLEHVLLDNKSNATESATVVANLLDDGVVAVVGPATYTASVPGFALYNDAEVPFVSPVMAEIRDKDHPVDYIFRMAYVDQTITRTLARFCVEELDAPNVLLLVDQGMDYSPAMADQFQADLEELGGKVVARESFQTGDQDFSAVLTNISMMDFDAIFVPAYYPEVGPLIRQARQMGIEQPFLGTDGIDSEIMQDLVTPEYLNDVYYVTHFSPTLEDEKVQEYLQAYRDEYGKESDTFAAMAFDSVNILLQAMEESGSTDPKVIKETLENMEFDGVSGHVKFNDRHDPENKPAYVIEMQGGEIVNSFVYTEE